MDEQPDEYTLALEWLQATLRESEHLAAYGTKDRPPESWAYRARQWKRCVDEITRLRADLATRTAERDEALKALEPFARTGEKIAAFEAAFPAEPFGGSRMADADFRTANRVWSKHQPKGDETDA